MTAWEYDGINGMPFFPAHESFNNQLHQLIAAWVYCASFCTITKHADSDYSRRSSAAAINIAVTNAAFYGFLLVNKVHALLSHGVVTGSINLLFSMT